MASGAIARLMGRSLDPRAGLGVPIGRTDSLGAIPHQPVDVIGPFADIESSLQVGVAFGVFLDGRNAQMLGEVDRLVAMVIGRDAKHDAERVLAAGQFLQRHGDLISGVKFEIEPERGLTGSNGTRQILALLAAFQHSQIRIEDVGALVRARAVDQDLAMKRRSACDSSGKHR